MTVHIGVDVGGTFTDFAVSIPDDNKQIFYKLPCFLKLTKYSY